MSENNSSRTPVVQDQLCFLDVIIIMLKYKWLIIAILTLTTIITIIYTYFGGANQINKPLTADVNQKKTINDNGTNGIYRSILF